MLINNLNTNIEDESKKGEVMKSIIEIPNISQEISTKIDEIVSYLWNEVYEKENDFRRSMGIDEQETELPKKQNEIFFNA